MNQSTLEAAIYALNGLLKTNNDAEEAFQRYLEVNRIVFDLLGYDQAHPKPRFPLRDDEYLEPDFMVRRPNGLFEVFELKTPQEKLVKTKPHRDDFYAKINEYLSQVETYAEYFDDRHNCETVRTLYSLDIQKKPDMTILAGVDKGVDKKMVHSLIRRRSNALRIMTYDELLTILLLHHARLFGPATNLTGASWHAIIKIEKLQRKGREYVFDVGSNSQHPRWSIYLDDRDRFCFEVVDTAGKPHSVSIEEGTLDFKLGNWLYLCCEFGNSEKFSLLQILVNNRIAAKNEVVAPISIPIGLDFERRTIGADIMVKITPDLI